MEKYKKDFKKAGWRIIETELSTAFISAMPKDIRQAMIQANTNTGYLSDGAMKFGLEHIFDDI